MLEVRINETGVLNGEFVEPISRVLRYISFALFHSRLLIHSLW